MPVNRHSGSPSTGQPSEIVDGALRDRHDGERTRQQMEPVVRQPHAEAERHERVRVVHGDLRRRSAAIAGEPSGRPRPPPPSRTQRRDEQRQRRTASASTGASDATPSACANHASRPQTGADHAERVQQAAEREQHRERGDVRGAAPTGRCPIAGRVSASSAPGTRAASAMLSCGHACTQSRQSVQSMLPTFSGRNSRSSQPRCSDDLGRLGLPPPLDAIDRPAGPARVGLLDPQLERRHRRRDEVELADRTEVLAEASRRGTPDRRPARRRSRRAPDRPSRAAAPRDRTARSRTARRRTARSPIHFVRSRAGSGSHGGRTRAARVAHQHERTAGAEQVAGREQRDDQQSAVVHPGEDRREVGRIDARRRTGRRTTTSAARASRTSWNAVRA